MCQRLDKKSRMNREVQVRICEQLTGRFRRLTRLWSNTYTLQEGENTIEVRQTDKAGNISDSTSQTLTVDTIAASLTIALADDTGESNDRITSNTELLIGNVEKDATVQYSLGNDQNWSTDLPDYSEGENTVFVRQVDASGNTSNASSLTFVLDGVISDLSAALENDTGLVADDGITNRGDFTISGQDEDASIEYSIDDGITWSHSFTPVLGDNHVSIRQIDIAGNVSETEIIQFNYDNEKPLNSLVLGLQVDSGTSDDLLSNSGLLTVEGSESGATIEFSTDFGRTWTRTQPDEDGSLGEGRHLVFVRQMDAAGNTSSMQGIDFRKDSTAPEAPAVDVIDNNIRVNSLAGTTVEYKHNDGEWSSDFEPVEGMNTVSVRQIDQAGNVSDATLVSFNRDTIKPEANLSISLESDSGSSSADLISNSGLLSVSGAEEGVSLEFSLNRSEWSTTQPDHNGLLDDGEHSIYVRQIDASGNTSDIQSITFTKDTAVKANLLIELQNDSGFSADDFHTNSGLLAVSRAEPGAKIQYRLNDGEWSTEQPDFDGNLASGPHTIHVRQIDVVGNTSASQNIFFVKDSSVPLAPVLSDTNGELSVSSEDGARVEYLLTDGSWSTEFVPVEGSNTAIVRQVDKAGNISESATITFERDTTPPPADLNLALQSDTGTSESDGITQSGLLTVTGAENGARVQYSLDGTEWQNTQPDDNGALSDGSYTLFVRQVDTAGNASEKQSIRFLKDTSSANAPSVVINNGDLIATGEDGSVIEYRLPGGNWLKSFTPVEGENTVDIRQIDRAGNISDIASIVFQRDSSAPMPNLVISLAEDTGVSNIDGKTRQGVLLVSGQEDDGVIEYSLNGIDWTTEQPDGEGQLLDGEYMVFLRQTDTNGNISASQSFSFTKDTTAASAPELSVINGSLAVNAEESAFIEYRVSGGEWQTSFTPVEGQNTVEVRQTDIAGNISDTSSLQFESDTRAPSADLRISLVRDTGESDSDAITSDARIVVEGQEDNATIQYSLNNIDWSDFSPSDNISFSEGENTIRFRQRDAAGNTSEEQSFTFTLDTTLPELPQSMASNGQVISGTGEPGLNVDIYVVNPVTFAEDLYTVVIDDDGNWSKSFNPPLAHATECFVEITDKAGNFNFVFVNIDSQPPELQSLSVESDAVSGQVAVVPGVAVDAAISITIERPDGSNETGSAVADYLGNWRLIPESPLPHGTRIIVVGTDSTGNVSAEKIVTVDLEKPGVTVDLPDSFQSGITFNLVIKLNEEVDSDQFDLDKLNLVGADVVGQLTKISDQEYHLEVQPQSDAEEISVGLAEGFVRDEAGNPSEPVESLPVPRVELATVEMIVPEITSLQSFQVRMIFSRPVELTEEQITLEGTAVASISGLQQESDTEFVVTVDPETAGTIQIALPNTLVSQIITVVENLPEEDSGITATMIPDTWTVEIDETLIVNIYFSEEINDLTESDFIASGLDITRITKIDDYYQVSLEATRLGDLELSLKAGAVFSVDGTITNTHSLTINKDFKAVDTQGPVISIDVEDKEYNPFDGINVVLTLNETPNRVLTIDDLNIEGPDGIYYDNFRKISETEYHFYLTSESTGDITVSLAENSFADVLGNSNASTNKIIEIIPDTTRPEIAFDNIPDITNGQPFSITITPSESIVAFNESDIQVTHGSIMAGSLIQQGSSYQVTIIPDGTGNVNIEIPDNAVIDQGSNGNRSAHTEVAWDGSSFTIGILEAPELVGNNQFAVKIKLYGDTSGLEDLESYSSGLVTNFYYYEDNVASVGRSIVDEEDPSIVTIFYEAQGEGDVSFYFRVNPAIYSELGHGNPLNAALTDVENITLTLPHDSTIPTVEILGLEDIEGLTSRTITFQFSEDVYNFDESTIHVTGGQLSNVVQVSSDSWSADLEATDFGNLSIEISEGLVIDKAANNSLATSSDSIQVIDISSQASVKITQPELTGVNTFLVDIEFSQDTTDFTSDDLIISNGRAIELIAVDNRHFQLLVKPDGHGDVSISLPENTVTSTNGGNLAASAIVQYSDDVFSPTIRGDLFSDGDTIRYSVNFDRDITGLTAEDWIVENGHVVEVRAFLDNQGNDSKRDFYLILEPSGEGELRFRLKDSSVEDENGILNESTEQRIIPILDHNDNIIEISSQMLDDYYVNRLDAGAGEDTLRITTQGNRIFSEEHIDFLNIENLDLRNSSNNTFTITAGFVSEALDTKELKVITDDSGDTLKLLGWLRNGQQMDEGGRTFDLYTSGDNRLWVDTEAQVHGIGLTDNSKTLEVAFNPYSAGVFKLSYITDDYNLPQSVERIRLGVGTQKIFLDSLDSIRDLTDASNTLIIEGQGSWDFVYGDDIYTESGWRTAGSRMLADGIEYQVLKNEDVTLLLSPTTSFSAEDVTRRYITEEVIDGDGYFYSGGYKDDIGVIAGNDLLLDTLNKDHGQFLHFDHFDLGSGSDNGNTILLDSKTAEGVSRKVGYTNTDRDMYISGDEHDRAVLIGEWVDTGRTKTIDGQLYHEYEGVNSTIGHHNSLGSHVTSSSRQTVFIDSDIDIAINSISSAERGVLRIKGDFEHTRFESGSALHLDDLMVGYRITEDSKKGFNTSKALIYDDIFLEDGSQSLFIDHFNDVKTMTSNENTLTIHGDGDDQVIASGWTKSDEKREVTNDEGETEEYIVLTNSGATLLVDPEVDIITG